MKYFPLIFSITQECPFSCDICLRYYDENSKKMDIAQWKKMIHILKPIGLKRLTITGGEPLILGQKLHHFLKFLHEEKIHTSLSTTGYLISKNLVKEMDTYLDHLLLSIRSLNSFEWTKEFGNTEFSHVVPEKNKKILGWFRSTNIHLEVSTVVHRENKHNIIKLGQELLELNPNIDWRLSEYYPSGIKSKNRVRFELCDDEFSNICAVVREKFATQFKHIRYISKATKNKNPSYLLAQNGDLIVMSGHKHAKTSFNVLKGKLPTSFPTEFSWKDYKILCRDWGWSDFKDE